MSHQVTLGGLHVPYDVDTLVFTTEGNRNRVSFDVLDRTSARNYKLMKGYPVEIENDDGLVFAGVLDVPNWDLVMGTNATAWNLQFIDNSALADRVGIYEYYDAATTPLTSDIVKAIIADYLSQFGVTEGVIEDGSSVSEVTYNGQTPTMALDELAKNDSFLWRIDDYKRLHYQSQRSVSAPWNITAERGRYLSMGGGSSLSDYANRVHQRGPASGLSDLRTESYPGDGVRKEFKLLYRANSNVSVKVNGVAKTLGIKGLDSGYDFYWKEGDELIYQDEAGTVLGVGDTIAITYRARVSLFVQIEDGAEIAARAAAEGTSGVYEARFEDTSALYMDLTVQAAETHLRQMGFDKESLTYTTVEPGLRVGMVQHIVVPKRSIDDDFLIVSVTASETVSVAGRMVYTVRAVSGERADDWVEFFRGIADKNSYAIRDNEIISKCVGIRETVVLSATMGVITAPQFILGTSVLGGGDAVW